MIQTLSHTLGGFYTALAEFLPHLLSMVVIIILGFLIALFLMAVVKRIFGIAKFRRYCESVGITVMMERAALPDPVEFLGRLVFWVVWLGFIVLGIDALGITLLQQQFSRFFLFLPQIFVALIVLFFGFLIANFFARATLLAAANANYASARLLSSMVRILIILLAVTMALDQVGLGHHVALIAFSIAFGAIMLGCAIAFGLGGRDVARQVLERKFLDREEKEKEEEISPL